MPCTGWALPAAIIVGLAASRGALAVTITWTGGAATNSWHTPANWNLNRVPEPGDDVVIPNMAPDVNVTYSLGSTTINSLTSAEAFTLTSGQATTLTINAASTLNGTFALSATLAGAGDVTVNGAMNWTGFGTMSGTGRTIISSSGSLTISDTSPKTLSRTLENHSANASWTNGNMQMNNGTFSNASSGTLTVNVPTGLNFSGFGGTNAVTNAGTFNKIGPATVSTNTLVQFNNTGTVNVDGGELLIGGGGANAGVMDVDAGTNLRLLSGMTHSPTSTLIGLGTLTFGGTHNFAGTLQTDRIIYMPGGAIVHLNANYTFAGTLNLGGQLGGSGDATITGTLNWTGFATMSGAGRTICAATATVTISDIGSKNLDRRLENHSPNVNWTGGNLQMNGGTLANESGGIITLSHNTDSVIIPSGPGTNSVTNAGVFRKTGPSPMTVFNTIPFNNPWHSRRTGRVTPTCGRVVQRTGTTLSGGTYLVAGTLQYPAANIATSAASIVLDGPASAIQSVGGGNALANFATNTASASFQIRNGRNLAVAGPFSNAGQVTIGPGDNTFSASTFNNPGAITKTGTGSGSINSTVSLTGGGTIDVQGGTLTLTTLTNFSGTTLTGGTYRATGALRFGNANIVTNAANITLDGPASAIENTLGVNALANLAGNSAGASLQIMNGRDLALSGDFSNSGQVAIGPGDDTLSVPGNYVQSAGSTKLDGGVLDPADLATIQGGDLKGNGSILGNVMNAGTCRPGLSPGSISISGDYTQTVAGTLEAEIQGPTPGTGYDQLTVAGEAILLGTLRVLLTGGFEPDVQDTFDIVTGGAIGTKFTTIEMPLLPNLKGWQIDASQETLRLNIVDCGPGDADGDGVGDACETVPDLSWFTIDGGGRTFSSGGEFKLGATIGQHDAGRADVPLTGGIFSLVGGFWAGVEIPEMSDCPLLGDMNSDGLRNGIDIQTFVGCLLDGGPPACSCADVNESGAADTEDITTFVQMLTN